MKRYSGYIWSDAWLLLSVAAATYQKSPATITDIRLYGDALNRAWLEDKELEHGFNVLIRDGFVTKENNMVSLTENGKRLVLSVRKGEYSFLNELGALYKIFDIKPPEYNWDVPKEVEDVRNKYYQIAKRLNAPEKFVRFCVRPSYYSCAYVEYKDGMYSYIGIGDRGERSFCHTTNDPDKVLFWYVKDLTRAMAMEYELKNRIEDQDSRRQWFKLHVELLEKINKKWAEEQRAEYDAVLFDNPFRDVKKGMEGYSIVSREESLKEPYPYVYVNDNGSYKELNSEHKKYLEEKFHPCDGDRPYVKANYVSKTPDGRMKGYLERSKLPKGLKPDEIPSSKASRPWWRFF